MSTPHPQTPTHYLCPLGFKSSEAELSNLKHGRCNGLLKPLQTRTMRRNGHTMDSLHAAARAGDLKVNANASSFLLLLQLLQLLQLLLVSIIPAPAPAPSSAVHHLIQLWDSAMLAVMILILILVLAFIITLTPPCPPLHPFISL